MRFEPIAIIGQSCVLPGALDPGELWDIVMQGRDMVLPLPHGYWRIDKARILTNPNGKALDRAWSDRGGYVRGFDERFDPSDFRLPAAEIKGLDPIFQWTLHGVREALRSAGLAAPLADDATPIGLVMGNLSYPTVGLVQFAESTWFGAQASDSVLQPPGVGPYDPRNRFSSGLPSHLAAQALNLRGDAFALDAACASSLYAIKLACDRLQDGRADVMVAGAVNRTDILFIHIGFCALQAMSRRGESRPFAADADGLVPGEGAAFVVLKRLDDAIANGDAILGVIRGIGLSNDGNAGGFLSPSAIGQIGAMEGAYAMAGLAPGDISLLECHATGTPVGDATEIESASHVFHGVTELPIGSLKSNLGHLITAAGAASLIKVLGALRTGILPPSRPVATPLAALAASPLRLLQTPEPWQKKGGAPRRAAISAFGLGGNNAHLIVEEWAPGETELEDRGRDGDGETSEGSEGSPFILSSPHRADVPCVPRPSPRAIAVVGVEATVGPYATFAAFAQALLDGHRGTTLETVDVDLNGLRFPPNDLKHTLPQQLLILEVARRLVGRHPELPSENTAVLIGMGCDPEAARYSVRWRLDEWADQWATSGQPVTSEWIEAAKAALIPGLEAAGVLGAMPNIPANRINAQLNCLGPSHTVSAEELSGLRALECAVQALRRGEIEAALVGAVDLSVEVVHQMAAADLLDAQRQTPGDAAVVLMLKRVDDAQRHGDEILAVVETEPGDNEGGGQGDLNLGIADGLPSLSVSFGHAHAASGLLHVAAGILCLYERLRLSAVTDGALQPAEPWLCDGPRSVRVQVDALGGQSSALILRPADISTNKTSLFTKSDFSIHVFSGTDAVSLIQALDRNQESNDGPARLVIIAQGEATLESQRNLAREALARVGAAGDPTSIATCPSFIAKGIYWSPAPIPGHVGFVFTPAAVAYQGMGRELLLALPDLGDQVIAKFPCLTRTQNWLSTEPQSTAPDPFHILQGCALISQLHATLTQDWLGIMPDAVLGVSSGETNALFATGAWHDMDAMFAEIDRSGMYTREIAGEYQTAQRAWQDRGAGPIEWAGWRLLAPVAEVEAALQGEEFATLTMINAPADCLVAGQAAACRRVVDKIGRHRCVEHENEVIAHHLALRSWEQEWRTIHHRETRPVDGVRFYANAGGGAYTPSRETAADALTDQATSPVDFRRVVEAAWNDGVRIFVEHGPRNVCSGWIRSILGEREHLAVALDRPQHGIDQLLDTVAQLVAVGVDVDYQMLVTALSTPASEQLASAAPRRLFSFPAHYPPIVLPPPGAELSAPASTSVAALREMNTVQSDYQFMESPPPLPPVLAVPPLGTAAQGREGLGNGEKGGRGGRGIERSRQSAPLPASTNAPEPIVPQHPVSPLPDPARSQMVEQLTAFHAKVSAAHQQFLAQQERAMARLAALHDVAATVPVVVVDTRQGDGEIGGAEGAPAPILGHSPLTNDKSLSTGSQPPQSMVGDVPAVVSPLRPTNNNEPRAPQPPQSSAGHQPPTTDPSPRSHLPLATYPSRQYRDSYPGPTLDRKQLEHLASGKISEVLGPVFARQDDFERQVRMPMPPLLLADRVLGIDAQVGAVGQKGVIWTETDIGPDSWYLHNGRVPVGVLIEAGQADLLLVSYLGADFINKGERVYRLLGCEVTFQAELPQVHDTLHYEIHLDGYAQQGPVRLFFFHYDCFVDDLLILSVRHGQAGFFTDGELAKSNGVIWDAHTAEIVDTPCLDPPVVRCEKTSFTAEQVIAFSEGRVVECFGDAFRAAENHVRTPTLARGRMLMFDEVVDFDPNGGPWKRGYLRAEDHLSPDEWFFAGHFKNDPCIPGTMMWEGCLQTMAFYMAGLGYTLTRDGWRFEPVQEETYKLVCRGQVTPTNKTIVYEVFVEEVVHGSTPTLYADLLVTVDGLAAFHCRRMGLRLVPSFPLESRQSLLDGTELLDLEPERNARTPDHVYGPRSIAACAWGKPSDAFGELFLRFDGSVYCPRLPGPPYLFITRITSVDAQKGVPVSGGTVVAEYQIPSDAWYFSENGNRTMPYAVLLEVALQPCGWFATYKGSVLHCDEELYFRNLDGTATQHCEVFPEDRLLRSHVRNTSVSRLGSMTIVGFKVECFVGDRLVFDMVTSFGFFPEEALASQTGLPVTDALRACLAQPSDFRRELRSRPMRHFNSLPALPGPMLLMLDRISGYWPEGGDEGLGRVRAEIDVNPQDWFFKCHFMGDSVQPGSLGLEAMIQTLQFYMVETDMGAAFARPRFEPIQLDEAMTWTYRGQVLPTATRVTVDLEIVEKGATHAVANASLWVDGLRIYESSRLGMRIVDDTSGEPQRGEELSILHDSETRSRTSGDEVLDPAHDTWLRDHCPTYNVPALAMMSLADRLAMGAMVRAPGRKVSGLRNVRVHRWLSFANGAQSVKLLGRPEGSDSVIMQLLVWEEGRRRYALVASGDVILTEHWQLADRPWSPVVQSQPEPNPYAAGVLFHGPAYQLLADLQISDGGASYWLDLDASGVPVGLLNQGLLDAAIHGIPHENLWRWSAEIPANVVAYPIAITRAKFYGRTPLSGRVRCEARFAGFQADDRRFPMIGVQIIAENEVLSEFELVETLFPKGPLGQAEPLARRAFLCAQQFVPGMALSSYNDGMTSLSTAEVQASDWLAGTVASVYAPEMAGMPLDAEQLTQLVAIKEHVARRWQIHPAHLIAKHSAKVPVTQRGGETGEEGDEHRNRVRAKNLVSEVSLQAEVTSPKLPLNHAQVIAQRDGDTWQVTDATGHAHQHLHLDAVRRFWRERANVGSTLVEDMTLALMQRFVRRVQIAEPVAFAALYGRGLLYLANHQLDLESALFISVIAALQGTVTTAVARHELGKSWVGPYFDISFQHPHIVDPHILLFIDRASPEAVFQALDDALERTRTQQNSLLVHVEGKHALQACQPVEVVSTALIDLAVAKGVPIVPLRFAGGLPVTPVAAPLDFPIDYGQQDFLIGAPLLPEVLAPLPSLERRTRVLDALNGFGNLRNNEAPNPGNPAFAAAVADWRQTQGVSEVEAVLYHTLAALPDPSEETQWLLGTLLGKERPSSVPSDVVRQWLSAVAIQLLGMRGQEDES
ncbi:MAG: beta-ketoacyl synthase [Halieaceae bacterium]|nr:beta-ketoacyl synthase [Halieaceae bacterium]